MDSVSQPEFHSAGAASRHGLYSLRRQRTEQNLLAPGTTGRGQRQHRSVWEAVTAGRATDIPVQYGEVPCPGLSTFGRHYYRLLRASCPGEISGQRRAASPWEDRRMTRTVCSPKLFRATPFTA